MRCRVSFFFLLLCLFGLTAPPPAVAQNNTIDDYVGRLPANTVFYARWSGSSSLAQLRASNPLLRLLDSPEMKANSDALQDFYKKVEARKQKTSGQEPGKAKTNSFSLPEYVPLLSNAGMMALLWSPPGEAAASGGGPDVDLLLLYDETGKENQLAGIENRTEGPGATLRQYDFEGVSVTEERNAKGKPVGYTAHVGHWIVFSTAQAPFESWLRAMRAAPEHSLKDSPAFQRARSLSEPAAQLNVYLDVTQVAEGLRSLPPAPKQDVEPARLVDALGLDEWDLGVADFTFEPDRTRGRALLLARPRVKSLPPILGASVTDFPSLDFAPADAFSYSVSEIDWPSAWGFVRRALTLLVPPDKTRLVDGVQAFAESLIGVTIQELAAAWGQEYAQISFPGPEGSIQTLLAFRVRDRERIVTAAHNLLPLISKAVVMEEEPAAPSGNDVVRFRFSAVPEQEEAQEAKPPFYFAAATPDWLLLSSQEEALDRALHPADPAATLRGNANFRRARARFPAALSSFGYVDADRWLASPQAEKWLQEFARGLAAQASKKEEADQPDEEQNSAPSDGGGPQLKPRPAEPEKPLEPPHLVLPRGYVHWLFSGSYRDAQGVHVSLNLE